MSYINHINASQEIVIDDVVRYSAVERYPHVLARLDAFWGYPEFLDYMESIIQDTRNAVRKGFPKDVMDELMFLQDLYRSQMHTINRMKLTDSQIIVLDEKLKNNDIWAGNFAR